MPLLRPNSSFFSPAFKQPLNRIVNPTIRLSSTFHYSLHHNPQTTTLTSNTTNTTDLVTGRSPFFLQSFKLFRPLHTISPLQSDDNMSTGFSNTDTGSKPADPYKEANACNNTSIQERVEDLIKFIEQRKFCMLTTRKSDNGYLVSRCMALAGREEAVDLLFHTNNESGKTDELVGDNHVNVAFLNSSNGDWASISGTAQVITDREYVKKHYSPDLKAWLGDLGDGVHDGSPNDPRVGVIKVHIRTATYALQKGTAIGRMVEVAKGAVTGSTASVNKLRELSESDLDTYRMSQRLVQ